MIAPRPGDLEDHRFQAVAVARDQFDRHVGPHEPVSYTHLRAHETVLDLVCRLLLEKKNRQVAVDNYHMTNHLSINNAATIKISNARILLV